MGLELVDLRDLDVLIEGCPEVFDDWSELVVERRG